MANPNNNAIFSGRLGADPKIFPNKDGSAKVKISLYAQNNFKNKDGSTGTVRGSFEAFLSKDKMAKGLGVYERMHKGDSISVMYEIRNNDYQLPDGSTSYNEIKQITSVTLNESKQITDARQANRAMNNQAAAAAEAAALLKQQEMASQLAS